MKINIVSRLRSLERKASLKAAADQLAGTEMNYVSSIYNNNKQLPNRALKIGNKYAMVNKYNLANLKERPPMINSSIVNFGTVLTPHRRRPVWES